MTEEGIRQELKVRVAQATLARVAAEMRISVSYLHDIVRGRRKPGRKILRSLGLQKRVEYVGRERVA